MLPTTNQSRAGRKILKRFLYSQMTFRDALFIMFGLTKPGIPFTVKAEPSSVYFNFRIKPELLDAFIEYINLPSGFEVCQIRCLADDESDYLLTLNVYEVTGLAKGIRAEWSTYIKDASGKPRYMVVEAQSSEYSMDPVDVITKKGIVEHEDHHDSICTNIASLNNAFYKSDIRLDGQAPRASIHGEWIEANDYIYWRNGICDRSYYDAGMANPKAVVIPESQVMIDDQTHWAYFLEPIPKHTIKYESAIELFIMPWFNI